MTPEDLAADFGRAAGYFVGRQAAAAAMVALLPLHLDEDQLHDRVHEMLRVAALLAGVQFPRPLLVTGDPVPLVCGVVELWG